MEQLPRGAVGRKTGMDVKREVNEWEWSGDHGRRAGASWRQRGKRLFSLPWT